MTHNRAFLESDRLAYDAMGGAFYTVTEFALPMGNASFQGYSPRCAGEAVANVAETCYRRHGAHLFPLIKPKEIYKLAKKLDKHPDHQGGTDISAAAEAYCRLAETGIRWMELPRDPQLFAAWMVTERTGIAFGLHWHAQDMRPNASRVLEYPGGIAEAGHAVHLFGWKRQHAWRRLPIFGRVRKGPVFLLENTNNSHPELPFYLPAERVTASGIQAVVLIPPTY